MNRRYILFIFCFSFLVNSIFAQKQTDIWYFGNKAGMDFSRATPIILKDSRMEQLEGSASIADPDGNLLFYTDGDTIWNRQHEVMPNGFGLLGHASATTAAVIIPIPGRPNQYYVFTADAGEHIPNKGPGNYNQNIGIHYSIVDMTLANGLGDVQPGSKNTQLTEKSAEKMAFARHCNDRDIWLITHSYRGNRYEAWLIRPSGIVRTPVTTNIGTGYRGTRGGGEDDEIGMMRVSPNGGFLATAIYGRRMVELYDFDRSSGELRNLSEFEFYRRPYAPETLPYGVEFSLSSQLLYVSTEEGVFQFDVSERMLDSVTVFPRDIKRPRAMQRATNGKIYIAKWLTDQIDVINRPNQIGPACDYQFDTISVFSVDNVQGGLPYFNPALFLPNPPTPEIEISRDYLTCRGDSIQLDASWPGAIGYQWVPQDGLSDPFAARPMASPDANQVYTITIYFDNGCNDTDDLTVQVKQCNDGCTLNANMEVSTQTCDDQQVGNIDIITDGGNAPYTYKWYPPVSTTASATNLPNGIYTVEITDAVGCLTISTAEIQQAPRLKMTPVVQDADCGVANGQAAVIVEGGLGPYEYTWRDTLYELRSVDSTLIDVYGGKYFVEVTDTRGCFVHNSVIVPPMGVDMPEVNLGTDTTLCIGDSITLSAFNVSSGYQWSNDSTSSFQVIKLPGVYEVMVYNDCGETTDEIFIAFEHCEPPLKVNIANIMTPNADGDNDEFYIDRIWDFPENDLVIYNRYGQRVFTTSAYNNEWRGVYKNEQLPVGTYYYLLRLNDDERSEFKGSVSIVY